MPSQNSFYHSHLQAKLPHSGLQPQSLEHINAQDILRMGEYSVFTGGAGQMPNTQGKLHSLHPYTESPIPTNRGRRP